MVTPKRIERRVQRPPNSSIPLISKSETMREIITEVYGTRLVLNFASTVTWKISSVENIAPGMKSGRTRGVLMEQILMASILSDMIAADHDLISLSPDRLSDNNLIRLITY